MGPRTSEEANCNWMNRHEQTNERSGKRASVLQVNDEWWVNSGCSRTSNKNVPHPQPEHRAFIGKVEQSTVPLVMASAHSPGTMRAAWPLAYLGIWIYRQGSPKWTPPWARSNGKVGDLCAGVIGHGLSGSHYEWLIGCLCVCMFAVGHS